MRFWCCHFCGLLCCTFSRNLLRTSQEKFALTVIPGGTNSRCTVPSWSKKQFNLLFCIRAFLGLGRPRTLSLRRLQFYLWVVSIKDAFIACDDVQEKCGIVYHSFLQFLTDRYLTVFLIVGQHSRHKLRCNLMLVQLFYEKSLTRSITNSNLCTKIVYGMTTILVDSRPYLFHC